MKQIYHGRYGVIYTWPQMPGGHTLTVRQLEKLQLKYKQEKLRVKNSDGDFKVQRSAS